jgi:excinuclease ABC subunit C
LAEAGELLSGFLAQYYLGRDAPARFSSSADRDADLLETTLSERLERSVRIRSGVRGVRARWLEMARTNAEIG